MYKFLLLIQFSVLKTLLLTQNHKFVEILHSKASKLARISIPRPRMGPKFSSHGYIFVQIQFTRVPNFAVVRSLAPLFGPSGHTPILK